LGTGGEHKGYDPSGRLIDRIGASGTKEKRYYADGLSPILVKQWDARLNSGAGGWKTMRTALQTPGVIGHVAAERHATAWNSSGTPTCFQDRYYHYDPLGNTVLETGVNATVLARTDRSAYGEMVRESSATGTWTTQPDNSWGGYSNPLLGAAKRPRQTTKETDPDTGLKWFGARWYDPAMGSWLGVDPSQQDGINLYAFAMGMPSFGRDANGHATSFQTNPNDDQTGHPPIRLNDKYTPEPYHFLWDAFNPLHVPQKSDCSMLPDCRARCHCEYLNCSIDTKRAVSTCRNACTVSCSGASWVGAGGVCALACNVTACGPIAAARGVFCAGDYAGCLCGCP
jgi:RHS repeat-associated protein